MQDLALTKFFNPFYVLLTLPLNIFFFNLFCCFYIIEKDLFEKLKSFFTLPWITFTKLTFATRDRVWEKIISVAVILKTSSHWRPHEMKSLGCPTKIWGSPMKIWDLKWKSWVSNENLGSQMKIWGLRWKDWGLRWKSGWSPTIIWMVSNDNLGVSNDSLDGLQR